jgi:hypothetical protein
MLLMWTQNKISPRTQLLKLNPRESSHHGHGQIWDVQLKGGKASENLFNFFEEHIGNNRIPVLGW